MRIAYLTSLYARAGDTFVRIEVRLLRKMGHEVSTYSIRKPSASEVVNEEIGFEYRNTDYILDSGFSRLALATVRLLLTQPVKALRSLGLALKTRPPGISGIIKALAYFVEAAYLTARLRSKSIEHVHNHIAEGSAVVSMLAANLCGIPFSLTIHGPSEFDQPMDIALREKIRRCAFIAVISEFTRSQVMRWCNFEDWPKIHIVRCGLDDDFLCAPYLPLPTENRLVCVGRLMGVKGQLVLIQAAARLAQEGLEFILDFIGDGELRPNLEQEIARHGLADRIRILGWKGSVEVREMLLASKLMVIPSFAEGLPVVLIEALALGRPVISTYIAGIPELVKPGINGWLVPAGSVDDLAAAMREALHRPAEELEKMGRAGAEFVRRRHNAVIEVSHLDGLITGKSTHLQQTVSSAPPIESPA